MPRSPVQGSCEPDQPRHCTVATDAKNVDRPLVAEPLVAFNEELQHRPRSGSGRSRDDSAQRRRDGRPLGSECRKEQPAALGNGQQTAADAARRTTPRRAPAQQAASLRGRERATRAIQGIAPELACAPHGDQLGPVCFGQHGCRSRAAIRRTWPASPSTATMLARGSAAAASTAAMAARPSTPTACSLSVARSATRAQSLPPS